MTFFYGEIRERWLGRRSESEMESKKDTHGSHNNMMNNRAWWDCYDGRVQQKNKIKLLKARKEDNLVGKECANEEKSKKPSIWRR